ncbi:hypothetical protein B0T24DRAFT_671222 [Lasiosphaeria ovina]|uniref:Uncharacterized protein n=1 Tax=Lasiosphaeria ovina TaxID=92902 RepID=A0AAE0JUS4_9PEZI|nr:hypothetical protein B0T24DRAFT_671222 [Lasiosphaeria ovina]
MATRTGLLAPRPGVLFANQKGSKSARIQPLHQVSPSLRSGQVAVAIFMLEKAATQPQPPAHGDYGTAICNRRNACPVPADKNDRNVQTCYTNLTSCHGDSGGLIFNAGNQVPGKPSAAMRKHAISARTGYGPDCDDSAPVRKGAQSTYASEVPPFACSCKTDRVVGPAAAFNILLVQRSSWCSARHTALVWVVKGNQNDG